MVASKVLRARTLGSALALVLAWITPAAMIGVQKILDVHQGLPDFDSRAGQGLPPSAQAQAIVSALGAHASWNQFGTPQSLIKYSGFLATGLSGDAVTASRNWIRANKELFKLSDAGVNALELVNDSKMSGYNGHAVIFRQKFGTLPAAQDGMITVGIIPGKIVYVSSSSAGDQAAPGAATLTPALAWIAAAIDVGRPISLANLTGTRIENGWTVFDADGFAQPQRARLVAFPTPTNGVRPAFETIVIDVQGGAAIAYKHFIDAQTSQVLFRQNAVQQAIQAPTSSAFQGAYQEAPAAPACGPFHGPYAAPAGTTAIDVVASAALPSNDIVVELHSPQNVVVAASDTATSPEAIHYTTVVPGNYFVRVCPFEPPTVPHQSPYSYAGVITISDAPAAGVPYPPKWRVFPANPSLAYTADDSFRKTWCWVLSVNNIAVPGCNPVHAQKPELNNLAARGPWDYNFRTNVPNFTTIGNAANTSEAWGSPLTPAEPYRPVAPDRMYVFPWTNSWFSNKCFTPFVPGNSHDINAAIADLFSMHNRMHDWSYFLGFTEANFNAQDNNFGNTQPGPYPLGRELDPEIGNAQAGAVSGGAPSYLGRDNANQITLNDGIPPITNQYLFQPIAAAFYCPCVDGDYDMSVVGHEYTHLISNRMVGGPDSNLSGFQAGSMGESWSDLNAVEYLHEYKFVPTNTENPFSVGAYVTGNPAVGIRNYSLDNNPLTYGDVGYDFGGPEVHSDGEIWNAVNFDIRKDLIAKYNASYPASNLALQRKCADGLDTPGHCPGNRRWIQVVFDAWLLMQPAVSMLDARDAYLAADLMRSTGTPNGEYPSNRKEIWKAFARRGFGYFASSAGTDDDNPIPNFESLNSPDLEVEKTVKFRVFAADEGNAPITNAEIFVGRYEARATPIADTIPGGTVSDTAKFVTGLYEFLVQAPGYGHVRFLRFFTATAGPLTVDIFMSTNRASFSKGAVATGTGDITTLDNLIDDTEETNWVGATPVNLQQVTVDLEGGVQNVKRVNVSAMLNPESGGRFTALRQFVIQTCSGTCLLPTNFTTIYTSPVNAFPGVVPRPAAPDLILRSFDVPDTNATHVRLKVLTNQCTALNTGFRGEQDNDPLNATDCVTASTSDDTVRAAELQVFTSTPALPPQDPAVAFAMTAPATASSGTNITYAMTYTNAGPAAASNAKITDVLPAGLTFVSASSGGSYNAATRTVTWNLGTVNVGFTGNRSLTAKVSGPGSVLVNTASFTADLTVATPAVAVTTVLP